MYKKVAVMAIAILMLTGTIALAERPETNVSPNKHPNIAAAQQLCREAYEKIVAAQRANEGGMGVHADKAKDLLEKAAHELKLAAEDANENIRR